MELPRRKKDDVYLPDGTFTATMERLRETKAAKDLRVGIVSAFDFRTRMLPYWYADTRMAPCSARSIGDALHGSGFQHIRIVLQQWNPNFKPSLAELDGQPLDLLLVSAMQVHAEPSYDLIRDAFNLGDRRPLIIAGGPKAIYEPTDYFELGPLPGVGADCVVTGEVYVLLNLLDTILKHHEPNHSLRAAFNRARQAGSLATVPGVAYLSPEHSNGRPVAINTGVQRLLRNLDEMPLPDAGYRLLERPHRGKRLKPAPAPSRKIRRWTPIASVITTQGCKFNCSYCPIPAVNQRTWRYKSPQRFAAEIKSIHENFGIRHFFGTDDNFFNNRETVVDLMTELARTETGGTSLGRKIRFYTEATQFDVHRNQDILPLCRKAGLRGIWFGIEDITADLVNKGQNAGKTSELFDLLHKIGIQPMAMMIHSDDQPLRSRDGSLSGLLDQARYLFKSGAVSYQCTYLGPAVGTRDFEPAVESANLYRSVGGRPVPQAFYDGNHVVSSAHAKPWSQQINVLRAYASFYNPLNTLRTILGLRRNSVSAKRLLFQFIGQIGLVLTAPRMFRWAWRLKQGPIEVYSALEHARIPMIDAQTGRQVQWAIETIPTPDLITNKSHPTPPTPAPAPTSIADRDLNQRADVMLPVLGQTPQAANAWSEHI